MLDAQCTCECASPEPASWKIETVDVGPQAATQPSLAIDADGFLHVAYQNGQPADLRHATNVTGVWVVEPVTSGACRDNDIAVDPAGSSHVVCTDLDGGGIRYSTAGDGGGARGSRADSRASRAGSWSSESIDPEGEEGSIALDSAGTPTLVYSVPCTNAPREVGLRRAILSGPVPHREQIDPDCSTHRASVQLDEEGAPHVSYAVWIDWNVYEIRHATLAGGAWSTTTLQTLDGPEYDAGPSKTSLAVDPSGTVHVVYARRGTLYHACGSAAEWTVETVDAVQATAGGAMLVADETGTLHLAYYERGTTAVRHATRRDGEWSVETVETPASDGYPDGTVGIGVDDARGLIHLTYRSDAANELRHAFRSLDDPACEGE